MVASSSPPRPVPRTPAVRPERRAGLLASLAVAVIVGAAGLPGVWAAPGGEGGSPTVVDLAGDPLPRVAVRGGAALPVRRDGPPPAVAALELPGSAPVALAAADLDGDGVDDLVVGWATADGGGALEVHRGNLALLWPDPAAPGDAVPPFLGPAQVLELPSPAERLVAGDLDGDGLADVAVAALGEDVLRVLHGDGSGGLGRRSELPLGGACTALAGADVNRRDGVLDLVVGVTGGGDRLLVLEGPDGALSAIPEEIPLPAPATGVATGDLDGDHRPDVVAAAGDELVVVRGRDRGLSLDPVTQAVVAAPQVERVPMPGRIRSLAVDDLGDGVRAVCLLDGGEVMPVDASRPGAAATGEPLHRSPGAALDGGASLVSTRTAGYPGADLVLVAAAARRLEVLSPPGGGEAYGQPPAALGVAGRPVAVLPMRLNADGLLDLVVAVDAPPAVAVVLTGPRNVFVVNTPGYVGDLTACDGICDDGGGLCSAVAASAEADCTAGADEIRFAVGTITSGPNSIVTGGAGGGPLTVDGTSFGALVRIDEVRTAGAGSVVRGMDAGRIWLTGGSGQVVEGNLVAHGGDGIRVGSDGNTVGGTTADARNVVIDNSIGIEIEADDTDVIGNYVGVDATGASSGDGNSTAGVRITSGSGNSVGGTTISRRNVLSGNGFGVSCEHLAPDNLVQGNLIGTDVTGTLKRGNSHAGVFLGAPGTTVGGTVASARNVIAGSSYGVWASGVTGGAATLIQGNRIGTNAAGTVGFGASLAGVGIESSAGITVGGDVAGARNLISGVAQTSSYAGVAIRTGTSTANAVRGNLVGTDAAGTAAIPNYRGIMIRDADGNTIGGAPAPALGAPCTPPCNVISGSTLSGVVISGSASSNLVIGNFVGTDITGLAALPNTTYGLDVAGEDSTIGVAGAGNLVSGNGQSGLWVRGDGTSVRGNLIGTDATGAAGLGNGQYGLWVQGDGVEIGVAGAGNVISGNTWPAMILDGTAGVTVAANLIGTAVDGETPLGNSSMGIWLYNGATGSTIGGTDPGESNVIANNLWAGVRLEGPDWAAGTGNRILSNSIHSNGALAIDLGAWGPDDNDPGDPDTGANQLQNWPRLTAVSTTATSTAVQGFLQSLPSTSFTLQVFGGGDCDPTGYGEAEVLIGTETVVTDATGGAIFNLVFPEVVPGALAFTATVTDPDGNTSEVGPCVSDVPGADVAVDKTGPATAAPGQTIQYVVTAVNIGAGYAFGVELTDQLPACLTELSCAVSSGSCAIDGSTVTATLGTLSPDEDAVLTITARVDPSCTGTLVNTASSWCLEDLNPTNDDDHAETTVAGIFADGFESGDLGWWSSSS